MSWKDIGDVQCSDPHPDLEYWPDGGVCMACARLAAERAYAAGARAGVEAAADQAAMAEYPMSHEQGITFNPSIASRIRAIDVAKIGGG